MENKSVQSCLEQCLFRLVRLLDSRGLFPAVRLMDGDAIGASDTIFITSLVLVVLAGCRAFLTKEAMTPALDALVKNRSADCTWNYWPRDSASFKTEPYPEDMDDTFMALCYRLVASGIAQKMGEWSLKDPHRQSKPGRHLFDLDRDGSREKRYGYDRQRDHTLFSKDHRQRGQTRKLEKILDHAAAGGFLSDYYSSRAYMAYFLSKAGIKTGSAFAKEGVGNARTPCEAALVASTLMTSGSRDHVKIPGL